MAKLTMMALFMLAIAFPAVANAQDEAAKNLQAALKSMEGKDVSLAANIELEKKKGGGVNPMLMLMSTVMPGAKDLTRYLGSIDVHLTTSGAIYAATTEGLPSLKAMQGSEGNLYQQVYTKTAFDLQELMGWFGSSLDMQGLAEKVGEAPRVRVSEEDGIKTYRVTIEGDFFKARRKSGRGNPMGMAMRLVEGKMKAQVIEGVMIFSVDSEGGLVKIVCELQYNDPMQSIMKLAEKRKLGENGDAKKIDPTLKLDQVSGDKVLITYTMRNQAGPAEAFVEEAASIRENTK